MMSVSSDPDANTLWSSLGGVAGMQALDRAFDLPETAPEPGVGAHGHVGA